MLAIIKTGGKQYKVAVGDKIKIEKLDSYKAPFRGFFYVRSITQNIIGKPPKPINKAGQKP